MMNKKILVKLYVPVIDMNYYVKLPLNKKIYDVIELLVQAIYELTAGDYNPEKMPVLYDRVTEKKFDVNLNIRESTIRSGMELMLI